MTATNDHPTPATLDVTDTLAALVDGLGLDGVIALLILGAVLLKSKKVRRWLSRRIRRAIRAALRAAWSLLSGYVLVLIRHGRIWPTWEEQRLLRRLAPRHWREHAPERGLAGTLTGKVRLTAAGITCAVRLDGQWTPSKLRAAEDHVRALLGLKSGRRMEIRRGKRGGWATLTIRTRSAVDSADLSWAPGREGIGLDTVTGEPVRLSPYGFRLVAGVTGMGKSVSLRPWIAEVLANPTGAVVYLDPKRQEQTLWGDKLRVAAEPEDIYRTVCELEAELVRRQTAATGTTWEPTREAPELVVIVDEGAAIVRMAKRKEYRDVLDKCEAIATMGRAARIWLIWATQYPTKEQGCPAQVVEMMLDRVCLTVDSAQADRTVFGENAAAKGWQPSELSGRPGEALVKSKGRKPNPVWCWHMTDDQARALPAGIVWQPQSAPAAVVDGPALTLVKSDQPTVPAQVPAAAPSTSELVLDALRDGESTAAALVKGTGRSQSQVYAALKALVDSGAVVKSGKRYALADADQGDQAAEVTA